METGSNILQNTGNAGLAYGTAGTNATAAPVGELKVDNTGFDTLARYSFLKKKDAYDADIKAQQDMFKAARELDLSTGDLLDVDKNELVNKYIPKIQDYLTKNPYSLSPRNATEIKQNMEIKRLIDDFKSAKSKGQVRAALKPQIDKEIANDPKNREDKTTWYNPQFGKPLVTVNPYQKLYNFDYTTLAGAPEAIKTDKYDGTAVKKEYTQESNLRTTYDNTLSKLNDGSDKEFQNYIDQSYNDYLDVNDKVILQRQRLLQQAAATDNVAQKAMLTANAEKIKPFYSTDINTYNNYATDYNTIQSKKDNPVLLPLISSDKPLTKEQFAIVNSVNKNVKQAKYEESQSISDIWKQQQEDYLKLKALAEKKTSDKTQVENIAAQVLLPFIPQQGDYQMQFEEAKKNGKTYNKIATSNDALSGIHIRGQKKGNVSGTAFEVNKNGITETIGIVDGKFYKYNTQDKLWDPADNQKISIDDLLITKFKPSNNAVFSGAELEKGKLKLQYVVEDPADKNKSLNKDVYVDRMTALKNIADKQNQYDVTVEYLRNNGITNLNDDAQFNKAVELITSKSSPTIDENKPKTAKKKLPGT